MTPAEKFHKFIQERPSLFEGGLSNYTPKTLVDPLLSRIDFTDRDVLVIYNIEFVIGLVCDYKVDPKRITFYADHTSKIKFAETLGVTNIVTNLNKYETTSRSVLLINPPYTNGKQDASEVYTPIISKCIDQFDPIVVGAITPENLINGGQKKKTLREKIFKKYKLSHLRFLNQKRDWVVPIKVDTISWIVEADYAGPAQVVSRHFDEPYIVSKPLHEYIDGGNQSIHDWMQRIQTDDKVKLRPPKRQRTPDQQIKITKDTADSWISEAGELYESHNEEWRVAFGYLRCNACAVVPPNITVPGKYRYLNFGDNEARARKFRKYMLSEPIRFIMKLIYTSRSLDNPQLAYVPLLNMDKFEDMNDDVLYKYWNVDDETRSQISKIIGDEIPF